MSSRENNLSTDQSLSILFFNKTKEIKNTKYAISSIENTLRNLKSQLEDQEEKLLKIKGALKNIETSFEDLINL